MQEKQVTQEHVERSQTQNQMAKLNTRNPKHAALLMAAYGLHLPPRVAVNILAKEGIETTAATVSNKMHVLHGYKLQKLPVNKLVRVIAGCIEPFFVEELEQAMPAESLKVFHTAWSRAHESMMEILYRNNRQAE